MFALVIADIETLLFLYFGDTYLYVRRLLWLLLKHFFDNQNYATIARQQRQYCKDRKAGRNSTSENASEPYH